MRVKFNRYCVHYHNTTRKFECQAAIKNYKGGFLLKDIKFGEMLTGIL